MAESITIKTKNGISVGTLKDSLFRKRVRSSKHLFKKLDAWGCDYDILYNELPEVCTVRIIDQDDDIIYQTSTREWKEHGTVFHFKEGTKDYNVQVFLPRKYFMRITNRPPR